MQCQRPFVTESCKPSYGLKKEKFRDFDRTTITCCRFITNYCYSPGDRDFGQRKCIVIKTISDTSSESAGRTCLSVYKPSFCPHSRETKPGRTELFPAITVRNKMGTCKRTGRVCVLSLNDDGIYSHG